MADTLVSYWEQESREEPGKEPNVKEMDLGEGEALGGNSFTATRGERIIRYSNIIRIVEAEY